MERYHVRLAACVKFDSSKPQTRNVGLILAGYFGEIPMNEIGAFRVDLHAGVR